MHESSPSGPPAVHLHSQKESFLSVPHGSTNFWRHDRVSEQSCSFQSQRLESLCRLQAPKTQECIICSDKGQRIIGIRFSAIISWCEVSKLATVNVGTCKPSCSLAGHVRTAFLPFIVRFEKLRLEASPSML